MPATKTFLLAGNCSELCGSNESLDAIINFAGCSVSEEKPESESCRTSYAGITQTGSTGLLIHQDSQPS